LKILTEKKSAAKRFGEFVSWQRGDGFTERGGWPGRKKTTEVPKRKNRKKKKSVHLCGDQNWKKTVGWRAISKEKVKQNRSET